MAVTITEFWRSRLYQVGQIAQLDMLYTIQGTSDYGDAYAKLLTMALGTIDGLKRTDAAVDPIGFELWRGSAHYESLSLAPRPGTGAATFNFDTTGAVQHISQSISTPLKSAIGTTPAPDLGGAIGAGPSGVEGVDITVPCYKWTETHWLSNGLIDDAYRQLVAHLTGRTNDAPFRGFATGEVLFLGVQGGHRGDDEDWELTYHFAQSDNRDDITIGDIDNIEKKGWEYVWTQYEWTEVGSGAEKVIVPQPKHVYIEQVYLDGDFGGLGLGDDGGT